ncbi:Aminopeptidase 1 [Smittium mucronatum]|uniref:Aminopeptidase n=1 Tax=Smittium mucronatum TaxID=133383 RepID=A0A1R0GWK7_9FUNG|nr:Aminopeptidase 1 [Smittium mucronatum]
MQRRSSTVNKDHSENMSYNQESEPFDHLLPNSKSKKGSYSPLKITLITLFSISIIALLFSNFLFSPIKTEKMTSKLNEDRVLLPKNSKPIHYDLNLTPDLEKLTFSGQVEISLQILEESKELTLHSNELSINSVILVSDGKSDQINLSTLVFDKKDDTVKIPLTHPVSPSSKVSLKLSFSGELNDLMAGFYRSRYVNSEGQEKFMATTQFEPTDARRAFPCFDEPALKATFSITLNAKSGLTALSNMDVKEQKVDSQTGLVQFKFHDTPIMSTYLIAFIVGELEYIEGYTSGEFNGKPIRCRVYTPPGQKERGRFALEVATKALEFFAESFGIAYPLPKLDQVAIPDFEAGAMENWGLVTYRTVALLVDEATSGSRAKQQVAATVSHELAHQWFGNLVTMEWWSELWLNEGFATWVGNLAVDHIFPEWHSWTQFLVDDYSRALTLDSMRSSHPIQVPVRHSSEISQIFDIISYSKGASTIRMLSSFLGLKKFLDGIKIYLQRHKYKNASTNDLWAALSEASGRDVGKFMNLWTQTIGYPILTVTDSDDLKSINIVQNRFLSSGNATSDEDKSIWWVPLLLETSFNSTTPSDDVLSERSTSIQLPSDYSPSENSWYKLNSGTVSIARIKYSSNAIKQLSKGVVRGEINVNDRIGLISDSFSLAFSGHSKTSDFLTLLQSYKNENNLVSWQEISSRFDTLLGAWSEEPLNVVEKLRKVQIDLLMPLMQSMGWDPKPEEDSLELRLRSLAIRSLGLSGEPSVIKEAKARFNRFLVEGDVNSLQTDIRAPVFAIGVLYGGQAEYDVVKSYYLNSTLPMDQRLIALNALGSTRDPVLVQKTLDFVLSDQVRNQDIYNGLVLLSLHRESRKLLWNWYKSNYDTLAERYRASMSSLGILVKICAGEFTTHEMANEVEGFLKKKDSSKFERALDQTLEKIRGKADWVIRDRADVDQWLASQ